MQFITLNQLAAAILGAGAYIYHCISSGGYWKAHAIYRGCVIERNDPSPYAAIAAVADIVQECEAQRTTEEARDTPAARSAYRAAWAATEGQPLPARFAAAEAAAAATEAAEWPSRIRTQHDTAQFMQRLRSITGRASAAEAAPAAGSYSPPQRTGRTEEDYEAEAYEREATGYGGDYDFDGEDDQSGRDYEQELAGDFWSQGED